MRRCNMNKKTIAVSLVLLTALAAVTGALAITSLAAANTNSTTNDNTTAATNPDLGIAQFSGNMMMDQGFSGPHRERGMMAGFGGMGEIEVSPEYTAAVNNILGNDTDVANLILQGYNVTAIHPIIHSVIEADGTITTKASTATVLLENGTSGYSIVNVDVANAKVTYITTVTKTVIDKSNS
jgi:hypothetical protein